MDRDFLLREPLRIVDGILDFVGESDEPLPPFYSDPAHQKLMGHIATIHAAHYANGSASGFIERAMKKDLANLITAPVFPVFDLGCGKGDGFPAFGGAKNIIGVDYDLTLLKQAKTQFPEATLIRAQLHALPFSNGVMRTAIANGVLEHVFRLEAALESIGRCMSPDGRFYVLVPTEGGLAFEAARFVTSQRNSAITGLTAKEARRAARIEHCNTVSAIKSAVQKRFAIEAERAWPFRIGGSAINLAQAYRLRPL